MSNFTRDEIEYLGSGLLGRMATVGGDGALTSRRSACSPSTPISTP